MLLISDAFFCEIIMMIGSIEQTKDTNLGSFLFKNIGGRGKEKK